MKQEIMKRKKWREGKNGEKQMKKEKEKWKKSERHGQRQK